MDTTKSDRNAVEKLADEFMQRRRRGESPTMEEYVERHPDHADEIRELFPALQLIENVRDDVAKDETDTDWSGSASHVGERLGDYRILREIGRGGMGIVYEADQETLGRRVALKVLSPELVRSPKYLERFQREARAAAHLQHTNIVPVFGVGEERGAHYYVMQYIHGRGMDEVMAVLRNEAPTREPSAGDEMSAADLATALESGKTVELTESDNPGNEVDATRDRVKPSAASTPRSGGSSARTYYERVAALVAQVADSLSYAHRRGVLHRDIKPSNLLLDVTGNVWVTDFGLAKIEGEADLTATGDVIGTLRYMPPESLRGRFDARGDIYGLGLTLYELVARRKAFQSSDRGELIRQISEAGPSRLPGRSGVPRDLETIIYRSIEREHKDRYSSSEALAADLRRFLRHEPVLARRISPPARLLRWAGRNRALAAVSALLLTGLLVGLVASLVVSARLFRLTDDLTVALEQSRELVYAGDIGLAYEAIETGDLGRARDLLDNHLPSENGHDLPDLRAFEWRDLWSRSRGNYADDFGPYRGIFLLGVACSPDGKHLAINRSNPQRLEITDVASRQVEQSIATAEAIRPLSYSPSGKFLVGIENRRLVAWSTHSWEKLTPLDVRQPFAMGHRADREIVVGVGGENNLSVVSLDEWRIIADLPNEDPGESLLVPGYGYTEHMANCLAISSGDRIVYLAGNSGIRRWDLEREIELPRFSLAPPSPEPLEIAQEGLCSVATSGDGQLAVADRWGHVHLLDPESGEIRHTVDSHVGWISCLQFSENGRLLVSAGADRKMVAHDPVEKSVVKRLLGHGSQAWGLDVSADASTIVSGGAYGGRVLTWSIDDAPSKSSLPAGITHFALMSDSRILLHRDPSPDIELYDPISDHFERVGAASILRRIVEARAEFLAASPNGRWIVAAVGNTFDVWDLATGEKAATLKHEHRAGAWSSDRRALFSPDSQFLVTAGVDSEVRLWRTEDWSSQVLCEKAPRMQFAGFSHDSRRVAIPVDTHYVHVFDLSNSPREVFAAHLPYPQTYSVALSKNGRILAAGNQDNVIRIFDVDSQQLIKTLHGIVSSAFSLDFSPDNRTLLSSSRTTVKLWNVATWREMLSVTADAVPVRFSPDGRYIAARVFRAGPEVFEGAGNGLRIWQTPTLEEIDAEIARKQ